MPTLQYMISTLYHSSFLIVLIRQYRLAACHFFVEWVLQEETLGKGNCIVLPVCVVHRIRAKYPFPNGQYRGHAWMSFDFVMTKYDV